MGSWEIPWTEEPGGLQSTGSQRVACIRARTVEKAALRRLGRRRHRGAAVSALDSQALDFFSMGESKIQSSLNREHSRAVACSEVRFLVAGGSPLHASQLSSDSCRVSPSSGCLITFPSPRPASPLRPELSSWQTHPTGRFQPPSAFTGDLRGRVQPPRFLDLSAVAAFAEDRKSVV